MKSIADAELKAGTFQCFVYVLEDGRRVLSQRGMLAFFGIESRNKPGNYFISVLENPFLKGPTSTIGLLKQAYSPIRFINQRGVLTLGYEAEFLVEFCRALLFLRSVRAIVGKTLESADQAERLIISVAKVGLVSLIDEATGYQLQRGPGVLQALLDRYLEDDFTTWEKRFPDEFYKEIYRLHRWPWGKNRNHPSCVGTFTNDLIYSRIEYGLLEELQRRNPWNREDGCRKGHHHCLLTEDLGVPKLRTRLMEVTAVMRTVNDGQWPVFKERLERAFPLPGRPFQDSLGLDA